MCARPGVSRRPRRGPAERGREARGRRGQDASEQTSPRAVGSSAKHGCAEQRADCCGLAHRAARGQESVDTFAGRSAASSSRRDLRPLPRPGIQIKRRPVEGACAARPVPADCVWSWLRRDPRHLQQPVAGLDARGIFRRGTRVSTWQRQRAGRTQRGRHRQPAPGHEPCDLSLTHRECHTTQPALRIDRPQAHRRRGLAPSPQSVGPRRICRSSDALACLVGDTGLEPVTSALSRRRSPS